MRMPLEADDSDDQDLVDLESQAPARKMVRGLEYPADRRIPPCSDIAIDTLTGQVMAEFYTGTKFTTGPIVKVMIPHKGQENRGSILDTDEQKEIRESEGWKETSNEIPYVLTILDEALTQWRRNLCDVTFAGRTPSVFELTEGDRIPEPLEEPGTPLLNKPYFVPLPETPSVTTYSVKAMAQNFYTWLRNFFKGG